VLRAPHGLDERGVREALLGYGAERAAAAALLTGRVTRQPGEVARGQVEGRGQQQREKGELPVEQEERAGEERDAGDRRDRLAEPAQDEGLDRLDVAAQS
jgi:hypothetical protein